MLKQITLICFLTFSCIEGQAQDLTQLSSIFIDDKDGQEYKTVVIGKYVILAENYNYEFEDSVSSFQCKNLKSKEEKKQFGRFYTYKAAEKLAPKGWRLPSVDDWDEISEFIKLKNEKYYSRKDVSILLEKGVNWMMMGSYLVINYDGTPNKSKPVCGKRNNSHYWLQGIGEGNSERPEGTNNYVMLWDDESKKDSLLYQYGAGAPFDVLAFPVRYIKDL